MVNSNKVTDPPLRIDVSPWLENKNNHCTFEAYFDNILQNRNLFL
jgi:hypothetical protein